MDRFRCGCAVTREAVHGRTQIAAIDPCPVHHVYSTEVDGDDFLAYLKAQVGR